MIDPIAEDRVRIILEKDLKDILLENGITNYNINSSFLDIGLNSISFIKLIVNIEKEFGIEIDDEYLDFTNVNNFETMYNIVYKIICNKNP